MPFGWVPIWQYRIAWQPLWPHPVVSNAFRLGAYPAEAIKVYEYKNEATCLQCLSAVCLGGTKMEQAIKAILSGSPMPFGCEAIRPSHYRGERSNLRSKVSNAFRL